MRKLLAFAGLFILAPPPAISDNTQPKPVGPELAPPTIGYLLRAYPILTQNNPEAIGGVGVLLWGCDYLVGRAKITITYTTSAGDPMPCKRKVRFQ
jgi:hypothetical protein